MNLGALARKVTVAHALSIAVALAVAVRVGPSIDSGASKRLLLGVVAVGLAFSLLRGRRALLVPSGGGLFLAWVGWSLTSIVVSPRAAAAPVAVLWVSAAALALGLSARGLSVARAVTIGAGTLLGVAVAGHVVVSFATGARGLFLEGAQGNPNWAGLVLATAVPIAIEGLRRARGPSRLALGLGVAAMATSLGLTHARVAWVALAVAALVTLVASRRVGGARTRALSFAAVTLLVVIGALLARTHAHVVATKKATTTPTSTYEAPAELAISGRLSIARIGLSAARKHAPLGAGLGGFSNAFLEAQGEALASLPPSKAARAFVAAETAHDDYVQVLVETGPLGLLLLVAAGLATLRAQKNPGLRAAFVVLAVGALGDSPLRLPALVAMLALLVAATPTRAAPRAFGRTERLVVVGAAALALAFAVRARIADHLVARAELEPEHRVALLGRAVRVDPWSAEATLRLGLARLDAGDALVAVSVLRRARLLEVSVAGELALAGAWDAVGDRAAAEVATRRALGLHPGSFRGWLDLASLLRARGMLDDATRALEAARSILPHHPAIEVVRTEIAEASLEQVSAD
ncbi:MAG: O-antigen ligase family protein [Myxococcales bacterium]|nr:O-antigen ligase family protein [Myxococcales bacterium]